MVSTLTSTFNTMEPTPTDTDGLPFSAPTRVPDGWDGGVFYGALVERNGIAMREVTFGWRVPDTTSPAVVHINSITDRRRENISFALLQPVMAGDNLWVRSYLLPEDSTWTYRFVSHPDLTVDIGTTRDGWLKFFSWGQPDPHNQDRLPTPLDPKGQSSVFTGKRARRHPDWKRQVSDRKTTSLTLPYDAENGDERTVTLHHGDTPRSKLLILFDGETWRKISPHPAAAFGARDYDIVLLDNVDMKKRTRDLPNTEHISRIVQEVIRESEKVLGVTRSAAEVVVAGQSYGGLAAATIAIHRPDLASTAISQSGSYWYQEGSARPLNRTAEPGDLSNFVASTKGLKGRVIVQVGSDEMNMVTLSRQFSERAQAAGLDVTHDEWRGGHDYAWWRHGLSFALDKLEEAKWEGWEISRQISLVQQHNALVRS